MSERGHDTALPGVEVFEEIEIVARAAAWPHEGPQRACRIVPGNFQLLEFEQTARVCALLEIDQLRVKRKLGRCGGFRRGVDPRWTGIRNRIHRHFRLLINTFFTLTEGCRTNNRTILHWGCAGPRLAHLGSFSCGIAR